MWYYVQADKLANAKAALDILNVEHSLQDYRTFYIGNGHLYNKHSIQCVHGWGSIQQTGFLIFYLKYSASDLFQRILMEYGWMFTTENRPQS